MAQLLMTGFPGFLGSALLPRLLARRAGTDAVCLVQQQHATLARSRVKELEVTHPDTTGRIRLAVGDITASDLGLAPEDRARLDDVTEVWHLAAVYDLAVPPDTARRVNVDGTANLLAFSRQQPRLRRLQYVSTCYVSGRHDGLFKEDSLEEGQVFRNHYEQTKYAAEVLVRAAMADGLPATVYRPGIVVGDSATGETQKYDGPYYLAAFLQRQPSIALVPALGDADTVRVCLVPRDFVVDAMDELSVLDRSEGRTYALVDPDPPTVREVVTTFARKLGRRVVWVPLPLRPVHTLVDRVPGAEALLGLPAEALDYFASPTTYATDNATTDLAASGLACPRFATYADRLLDFMREHPEYDAHAMT
ncbi:MAG TPA: SDR family oxidoreductase [Ornithinibacter sp.]|nr:SDR family oxidoreductase [Ornithinibacter sp.]